MNILAIINGIKNIEMAIRTVKSMIDEFKQTGALLQTGSEEQLEAAIQDLEALLEDLRASTQAKLRGTPEG